jgi:hypothetical protein
MSSPESKPPNVSSHAPLLQRLRGEAFLPGVQFADQAEVWMREAAEFIEDLLRERVLLNERIADVIVILAAREEDLRVVRSQFAEYIHSVQDMREQQCRIRRV